jgi:hypothetical protein
MYIVGHFIITERSGALAPERIYGDGAAALAFPDYVLCHDWGYERCFVSEPLSPDGIMIRAHLLGDWYVHYGEQTVERKKIGWAYRRMGVYARRYDEFFAGATRLGLRDNVPPKDSVRGFSHTMMEYTIDTFLAEQGEFNSQFDAVRGALKKLGGEEGIGSGPWIDETIRREGVAVSTADMAADITSYSTRVSKSTRPSEFAYRAGIKKFGLRPCDESMRYVSRFIGDGLNEVPGDELSGIIDGAAEFVGRWLRYVSVDEGGN